MDKASHYANLTQMQAIRYHLSLETKIDDKTIVFSSLAMMLQQIRKVTNRNLLSGKREISSEEPLSESWLAACGYLTILDQLGKCYRPKSKTKIIGNEIIKCLKYFTILNDKEINAIYALRCALMHDFSLFNIGGKKKAYLNHHFTFASGQPGLLQLPKQEWDGSHNTKTFENMTFVNLPILGDTVEEIYQLICKQSEVSELEVDLDNGYKEIKDRYLMYSYSVIE